MAGSDTVLHGETYRELGDDCLKIADYCSGIQHLGIPTEDLEKSRTFYEKFGFQTVYTSCVEEKNQHVVFLELGNLMLEIYEEPAAGQAGAINHFAIDCLDIEKAYQAAKEQGCQILSDGIEGLDFWERGIRYFILEGPNRERIELCQRL